jgi:hypothetical protein
MKKKDNLINQIIALSRLEAENAKLRERIVELEEKVAELKREKDRIIAEIQSAPIYADGVYIENPLTLDQGVYVDKRGELFCPRCYKKTRKRIHIMPLWESPGHYACPRCRSVYDRKWPPKITWYVNLDEMPPLSEEKKEGDL